MSFCGEDSKSDAGGSLSLVFQTRSLREVFVFSHISVETLGNSDRRSRRETAVKTGKIRARLDQRHTRSHNRLTQTQTEVPNTPAETQNGSMKKMRHAETIKRGDRQTANHND